MDKHFVIVAGAVGAGLGAYVTAKQFEWKNKPFFEQVVVQPALVSVVAGAVGVSAEAAVSRMCSVPAPDNASSLAVVCAALGFYFGGFKDVLGLVRA